MNNIFLVNKRIWLVSLFLHFQDMQAVENLTVIHKAVSSYNTLFYL